MNIKGMYSFDQIKIIHRNQQDLCIIQHKQSLTIIPISITQCQWEAILVMHLQIEMSKCEKWFNIFGHHIWQSTIFKFNFSFATPKLTINHSRLPFSADFVFVSISISVSTITTTITIIIASHNQQQQHHQVQRVLCK